MDHTRFVGRRKWNENRGGGFTHILKNYNNKPQQVCGIEKSVQKLNICCRHSQCDDKNENSPDFRLRLHSSVVDKAMLCGNASACIQKKKISYPFCKSTLLISEMKKKKNTAKYFAKYVYQEEHDVENIQNIEIPVKERK